MVAKGSNRCQFTITGKTRMWRNTQCPYRSSPGSAFCRVHANRIERERDAQGVRIVEPRPPVNSVERWKASRGFKSHEIVAQHLRARGVDVVAEASGWPDLLVSRDGKLAAIEVKAAGDTLRGNQRQVLDALSAVMPVFVCRINAKLEAGEHTLEDVISRLGVVEQLPLFDCTADICP